MLKKDSFFFGILIGLIVPLATFGILHLINYMLTAYFRTLPIEEKTIYLICAFSNLIPLRIYFVNYKMDKTGRSILMVTFALMILFFVFAREL